jgi:hypothetical protein
MAPDTRYNIALLEKVRDQIVNEDSHDQGLWARVSRSVLQAIPDRWADKWGAQYITVSCPTAACVAGWAASMSGGLMLIPEDHVGRSAEAHDVLVKGEVRNISNYAREQLGLSPEEADALFAGEWTTEETLDNLDEIIHAGKHGMLWSIRHHGDEHDEFCDGVDY